MKPNKISPNKTSLKRERIDEDSENYHIKSYHDNNQLGIQFASDLHLETNLRIEDFESILKKANDFTNILVLGGDICNIHTKQHKDLLRRFLEYCANNWSKVFYIPGNHEYYYCDYKYVNDELENMCNEISSDPTIKGSITFAQYHVHYLEFQDKTVALIMTTLWSYIPPNHEKEIEDFMPDYSLISNFSNSNNNNNNSNNSNNDHQEKFTARFSSDLHEGMRNRIKVTVENLIQNSYQVLVFTHHAPTFQKTSDPIISAKNVNKRFAFASNCLSIIDNVSCWVYGHTHFNNDLIFTKTETKMTTILTSNQKGSERFGGYGKNPEDLSLDYCNTKHLLLTKNPSNSKINITINK